MSFHIDPGDPPTRAEAEADQRDDYSPWVLNAYATTHEHDDGRVTHAVHIHHGYSQLLSSRIVANAAAAILRDATVNDMADLLTVFVKAYGEKLVAMEHAPPPYEPETDWDDSSDQYDPF